MNDELQRQLGIAAIIFAILFGLGSCSLLAGIGQHYAGKPLVSLELRK